MTTEITKIHNPKLPPLPAYAEHLEKVLPEQKREGLGLMGWIVLVGMGILAGGVYAYYF